MSKVESVQQIGANGRYFLLGPSGSGGMARVYRAHDKVLGRDVALKVLREQYAEDEGFVRRFRREARNAAALSHPNIVPIYDLGRSEDGAHYIAMEYVSGGTLKERIVGRGPLAPRTAASMALQIAKALTTAHEKGVIHRDIKSQNVLVTETGDLKVADFGIARAASATALTQTNFILGTANYMSPEQAMEEEVGPRSDLYSLGVVLYEMLTGKVPYTADTPVAIVMKHVSEPPRAPREAKPEVPEGISALVVKLLAKRPEDRYRDAAELVEDLQRIMDGLPPAFSDVAGPDGKKGAGGHMTAAGHTGGLGGAGNGKRRLGKLLLPVALSAVMVLLLLGVVGWSVVQNWESESRETPEEVDRAASVAGVEPPAFSDSASVFVHRATPENISANSTYLDNPLANGNQSAILYVAQNWNPEGGEGTYNDHPVGVWYDANRQKWAIFNQDRAAIPDGSAFNVLVSGGTTEE